MVFKRVLALALAFVMLFCCLYTGAIAEEVSDTKEKTYSGVVRVKSSSVLNVRTEPYVPKLSEGEENNIIGELINNDVVIIHGEKIPGINGDKNEWYKIEYEHEKAVDGFAYIAAQYVVNVLEIIPPAEYEPDATFEENLEKQGFPESYKVLLRQLHQIHPNWVFIADHINLTWDEVLAAESAVGKSLVENTRPDSYKSMEYGAYKWETGSYIGFDGSKWVTASRDVVAYYLEPRNFLNERGIYQFLDQTLNEKQQTIEGVNKIIENSFMSGEFPEDTYETYADLLMAAAKASNVSPYVLAAMIIQEQGRGGASGLISGNYNSELKGYFNHFNIGAYADDGLNAIQRGLRYARGDYASDKNIVKYDLPWNSRAKSIIGGAIWFGSGYIDVGQDTLYYKKWDVIGPSYYGHQYMTNVEGANSEALILRDAYADLDPSIALTFSIPVYKNMPEENKTALPENGGANNYYLSDIVIEGHSFSPEFDKYKNAYELVVEYEVQKINVTATAVEGATVSGTGEYKLEEGNNEIVLTVTAASGKTAVYTLHVARKEGDGEIIIPDPEIESKYTFGDYLTGIQPLTETQDFLSNFTIKNGSIKVYDLNGAEKTSGKVATGDRIKVYNTENELFLEKIVMIYGDINGNGDIDAIDLIRLQKQQIQLVDITGIYAVAADVNRDGSMTAVDLIRIQKHLIQLITIEQ